MRQVNCARDFGTGPKRQQDNKWLVFCEALRIRGGYSLLPVGVAICRTAATRDMGLPGLGLHPLKGIRHGTWAVNVSGNWRVTFRFDGPDVTDVDYQDYH